MVVLGGWVFLMSEVPLYSTHPIVSRKADKIVAKDVKRGMEKRIRESAPSSLLLSSLELSDTKVYGP